jgi:probable rRNA maturation factor
MKISYTAAKLPAKTLTPADLRKIAKTLSAAPLTFKLSGEAGIAFVSSAAIKDLNHTYRGKNKATNVLSFPQYSARELKKTKAGALHYLGDIALCLPVIRSEAQEKKIPLKHHLIHLVVHGTLHLLGYDHEDETEACRMEKLEVALLANCHIPDPYSEREPTPNRKRRAPAGSRVRKSR